MHDTCDETFQFAPWHDLDLWPTSRSKLLPSGGPHFSEFACCYCRLGNAAHLNQNPKMHVTQMTPMLIDFLKQEDGYVNFERQGP